MELCRIDMEWLSRLELLWIESTVKKELNLECDLQQSELNRNCFYWMNVIWLILLYILYSIAKVTEHLQFWYGECHIL